MRDSLDGWVVGAIIALTLAFTGLLVLAGVKATDERTDHKRSPVDEGLDRGYLENASGMHDNLLVACDAEYDGADLLAVGYNREENRKYTVADLGGALNGCGQRNTHRNLEWHKIVDRQNGRSSERSFH